MKKYMDMARLPALGLLIAGIFIVSGCSPYGPGHQGTGGWGQMMPWMGGSWMWIVLLIIAAVAIWFMVRQTGKAGRSGADSNDPMEILRRRYARGEIDKDEYERMRKELWQ